jgi:type VI secretion system protein VasD
MAGTAILRQEVRARIETQGNGAVGAASLLHTSRIAMSSCVLRNASRSRLQKGSIGPVEILAENIAVEVSDYLSQLPPSFPTIMIGRAPWSRATLMSLRSLLPAIALCIAALLDGCASSPPPPVPMTCVIATSNQVNPTINGRPSPLLMRLYALKSAAAFENADFIALYQHDQTELGADLVGKDEFTLTPGDSKPCSKLLPPEARFIGVVGAFRDVEHATWRAVAPIEGGKKASVMIRVDALALSIVVTH